MSGLVVQNSLTNHIGDLMHLFKAIHEKAAIQQLKDYYSDLGFKTQIEGNMSQGMIVNVSDSEEFDFFDKQSSGLSFGVRQFHEGNYIDFWSIRLLDDKKGQGLARKLVTGFIDILQPIEVVATDLAKEGFAEWLERSFPNVVWSIDR